MSTKKQTICCPHCGKKNTWTKDNKSRPFCSARCKLIDLGAWADGQHSIPGDPASPDDINRETEKNSDTKH